MMQNQFQRPGLVYFAALKMYEGHGEQEQRHGSNQPRRPASLPRRAGNHRQRGGQNSKRPKADDDQDQRRPVKVGKLAKQLHHMRRYGGDT